MVSARHRESPGGNEGRARYRAPARTGRGASVEILNVFGCEMRGACARTRAPALRRRAQRGRTLPLHAASSLGFRNVAHAAVPIRLPLSARSGSIANVTALGVNRQCAPRSKMPLGSQRTVAAPARRYLRRSAIVPAATPALLSATRELDPRIAARPRRPEGGHAGVAAGFACRAEQVFHGAGAEARRGPKRRLPDRRAQSLICVGAFVRGGADAGLSARADDYRMVRSPAVAGIIGGRRA